MALITFSYIGSSRAHAFHALDQRNNINPDTTATAIERAKKEEYRPWYEGWDGKGVPSKKGHNGRATRGKRV